VNGVLARRVGRGTPGAWNREEKTRGGRKCKKGTASQTRKITDHKLQSLEDNSKKVLLPSGADSMRVVEGRGERMLNVLKNSHLASLNGGKK